MCGITGFIDQKHRFNKDRLHSIVREMSDRIMHRGPDDDGYWVDETVGIAFGHRRLAIIDLTPEGHQPMVSASGRYCIIYNGEIYNFQKLRIDLEQVGYLFRGHSDTEIILAAIESWGVEESIKRFVGMFAFAVYDKQERMLYLTRDRVGEKPLYYGWMNGSFLFSSELKSLKAHPDFAGCINRAVLSLYLQYGYIPAPHSIYQGVFKLEPGTLLTVKLDDPFGSSSQTSYWSAYQSVIRGIHQPFSGNEDDAVEELDRLMRDSIKQQMIADVPLGAFLSGGIDSTSVVALMQALSSRPVKTFTIGFHESGYNEAEHAKTVANYLGTDHTECYVSSQQALEVIPKIPALYDEPFADASQIPTYLVSHLARQHVTVSLSGDGGDELFGGYNRYFWGRSLWPKLQGTPYILRKLAGKAATSLSPMFWDRLFDKMGFLLPQGMRQRQPGDKIHKLANMMTARNSDELYDNLVSFWREKDRAVLDGNIANGIENEQDNYPDIEDFTMKMMYKDMISYLPDDILVKVDRASMGVSLESRVPLLDHRIIEFAYQLPMSMKIRNGKGKWLLNQVLHRYVPEEMMERPKMGFGVPIDSWLRGPLRDWAESLLNADRLNKEGFFNSHSVRLKWEEHLSGKRNWQYYIWNVLMFQAWYEKERSQII